MITAEEFVKNNISCSDRPDFERKCELVIKFAKLHVTKALKKASEKVILLIDNESIGDDYDCEDGFIQIDKLKILNAYPLENIK